MPLKNVGFLQNVMCLKVTPTQQVGGKAKILCLQTVFEQLIHFTKCVWHWVNTMYTHHKMRTTCQDFMELLYINYLSIFFFVMLGSNYAEVIREVLTPLSFPSGCIHSAYRAD